MGSDGIGPIDHGRERDLDFHRETKVVSQEEFHPGKVDQSSFVQYRVTFGNRLSDWSRPRLLTARMFDREEDAIDQGVAWVRSVNDGDDEDEMMAVVTKVETTVTATQYIMPATRNIGPQNT